MIDIDTIFALDRELPPAERSLPWEENRNGHIVVIEPKPHWASDLLVYTLTSREYCCYRDWAENGSAGSFIAHVYTTGDDVMMKARAMIAVFAAKGFDFEFDHAASHTPAPQRVPPATEHDC